MAPTVAPPPEPKLLTNARQRLNSRVLGNVVLGGLRVSGEAVLATLKAPRSTDTPALEERLRAASITYKMQVPPIWSGNTYHLEILVWPWGGGAKGARLAWTQLEGEETWSPE